MSKGEEGFTITEALVSIGIISIAGMIVLGGLSSSIKGIDRAKDRLGFGIKLLWADELIRREAGAVTIPYWERRVDLMEDHDSIQVPWYGGRAGDYLRFFWDEYSLSMETKNGEEKKPTLIFTGLDHVSVSVLSGEGGIPRGLDIAYAYGGKEYRTRASFSSLPVQAGRP
jgi:type II secretory pathway component PulJ